MWGFNLTGLKYRLSELDRDTFEERVKRVRGELETLDYDSIVWMRTLPLYVRKMIDRYKGIVSTDDNPVFLEV